MRNKAIKMANISLLECVNTEFWPYHWKPLKIVAESSLSFKFIPVAYILRKPSQTGDFFTWKMYRAPRVMMKSVHSEAQIAEK